MNLAFATLIILILLAPGFIFTIGYRSSKLSIQNSNKNLFNEFSKSIIPTIILQTLGLFIIENWTGYSIDFGQLANLVLGVDEPSIAQSTFESLKTTFYPIFWYHITIFVAAYFLGHIFRILIRLTTLDRKIPFFRFSNKWHYLIGGECLDFPDVPDDYSDVSITIADALCRVNGKTVIYIGEVIDYYVKENGDLSAIQLRYPIRRDVELDNSEEDRYYEIASRYLIIPNESIINLNIRFFNYSDVEQRDFPEIKEGEVKEEME